MLKNRIRFTTSIPKELKEELGKLSEYTRINQSKLIEEAIEDLLKKYENKKTRE